jgi:UDP-N-acetylmuramoylalanine--D-glutamate ligase
MRALVIGMGVSASASTRLLEHQGASVIVVDDELAPLRRMPPEVDVVVPSPGVPPQHHLLRQAARSGLPIWSDIELAARWWAGRTVAVTGTNGKGSVVTMVTSALQRAGVAARAVGNIGDPMGAAVLEEPTSTVLVVEASSFQLHFCDNFSPDAAAVLNVTADHLDWHRSLRAYRRAKGMILSALRPGGWAVVNAGDRGSAALAWKAPPALCRYRRSRPLRAGLGIAGGWIVAADEAPGGGGALLALSALGGRPPHHLDNAMAVLSLVRSIEPKATDAAVESIAAFRGLPHLRQCVAQVGGVSFVDDSKATNPSAAAASLGGGEPIVLICGGRNKGLSFELMVEAGREGVQAVVGIGEAGPELVGLFGAAGVPGEVALDMTAAVRAAAGYARPGDVVLLAPGCSSFDMFSGQAARGEAFVAAAEKLGATARARCRCETTLEGR